jgi:hypothetical protein
MNKEQNALEAERVAVFVRPGIEVLKRWIAEQGESFDSYNVAIAAEVWSLAMTEQARAQLAAPSPAPASDVVQVPRELLELIEQSWRVPNGLPKSVPEHAEAKIVGGLAQLRALLNGGRV